MSNNQQQSFREKLINTCRQKKVRVPLKTIEKCKTRILKVNDINKKIQTAQPLKIIYQGLKKVAEEKTISPTKWIDRDILFEAVCHVENKKKLYRVDGIQSFNNVPPCHKVTDQGSYGPEVKTLFYM